MEWLQGNGVVVVLAGTVLTAVGLGWRILESVRDEIGKVRGDIEKSRLEARADTEKVRQEARADTERLRQEARADTEKLRQESRVAHESIGAQIAALHEGQASLREGLGEIRGELSGVTRSIDTLREDFRAHVLGSAAG